MPIDNTQLGDRIKVFRAKKNISQEELAEISGNSRVFIGRLERGERTPSLETIVAIAEALGTVLKVLEHSIVKISSDICLFHKDNCSFNFVTIP